MLVSSGPRGSSPPTTRTERPEMTSSTRFKHNYLSGLGFWYFKALSHNISIHGNVLFPESVRRREPSPPGEPGVLSSQAINSEWQQVNHQSTCRALGARESPGLDPLLGLIPHPVSNCVNTCLLLPPPHFGVHIGEAPAGREVEAGLAVAPSMWRACKPADQLFISAVIKLNR